LAHEEGQGSEGGKGKGKERSEGGGGGNVPGDGSSGSKGGKGGGRKARGGSSQEGQGSTPEYMRGNLLSQKCRTNKDCQVTWEQVTSLFATKDTGVVSCTQEEWEKHPRSRKTAVPFSCSNCGKVRLCTMRDATVPLPPHPRLRSHTSSRC
jgi:hypothetical protein